MKHTVMKASIGLGLATVAWLLGVDPASAATTVGRFGRFGRF